MIRGYVFGFNRPSKETRYGSSELITDGKYNLLFDGYCGSASDRLIEYLIKRKYKDLYLFLTHSHYDHTDGFKRMIKNGYFNILCLYCYDPDTLRNGLRSNRGSKSVVEDINALEELISLAKSKGIEVKFIDNGDKITLGDIKIEVYREQPTKVEDDDTEGWSYVNDGSLCFYFPQLYYWTSGDGPEKIGDFIKNLGLKVKFFQVPHHGNNCTQSQARGLKSRGAVACWYNDLEPDGIGTTGFTQYGARRCKEAGLTVLDCVGDINWVSYRGYMYIYHGGKKAAEYSCPYSGKTTLKSATPDIVRNVFMSKYGKSDARVTNLLNSGYSFESVQDKVNLVYNVASQIISGKTNLGKNETRLKNLDNIYGTGYGQLIQDEINSLLKAKSAKW